MAQALYRKYRPQTFAEVAGQEHIKATLQQEIATGKLAHAYLFCGMRGVGKTTVARLLAKAVNCERRKPGESEPCDACESCQAITQGRSLDLIEVDAASNRRIDDIRELRDHIPTGTASGRYKVVIIDEVHMLTTEAFNALLKTLEEPPSHVLFVLATTEVHKLPDTIVSRCQRFDFHRLSILQLVERLGQVSQAEGVKVDIDVLKEIAYLAGGSTRDAESGLGKLVGLGDKHITIDKARLVLPHSDLAMARQFLNYIIARQAAEAVALLNQFLEQGGEIGYFHQQVAELLRAMLYLKLAGKLAHQAATNFEPDVIAELTEAAQAVSYARLQRLLEMWLAVESSWRTSEVWQLPVELAAVSMAQPLEVVSSTEALPVNSGAAKGQVQASAAGVKSEVAKTNLPLESIADRWGEVVGRLKDINHSLSFIMSVAKPIGLEGGTLTVAFQYQLHQERLKDAKVRGVLEQAIQAVLGVSLAVRGVVEQATVPASGDLLSSVLTTMGGRLVD